MPKRRRKTEGGRTLTGVANPKISGLRKTLTGLGLCLFLAGCSLFNRHQETNVSELIQKMCLSAEGQSRIHFRNNRYLVRFESFNQEEGRIWYIALDVPGRGQEVIEIHYQGERKFVRGAFYQRLLQEARNEHREVQVWLREFTQLLTLVPEVLGLAAREKLDCHKGICQGAGKKIKFYYEISRTGLNLIWPTETEGLSLHLVLSDLDRKEEWFKRMNFRVQLADRVGPEAAPAELYLFLSECRAQ